MSLNLRNLSPLEARVLGVLIEKAHTVPDSYPLSLNSLTLGCNQKTARDPVLSATEAEVQMAADALKGLNLAFESSGSRVSRYEHNLGRALAGKGRLDEAIPPDHQIGGHEQQGSPDRQGVSTREIACSPWLNISSPLGPQVKELMV